MLQTYVTSSDHMTREDAQRTANAWQRPVTVTTRATPHKVRFRVRPSFRSFEDIKKRNAAAGQFWFEASTMRFFRSRVGETFYGSADGRAYFVSSEKGPSGPRAYSVRVAHLDGSIDTAGEFQGYRTSATAHAAARRAASKKEGV